MFQFIVDGLVWLLDQIVALTGSYGVAIILVTLLIRLVLYPLTVKQTKSMVVMRELQPKLKEIQDKYKDNPQELNTHTMKLYKDHNVNPLGGCLPMFIQLPVIWAFLRALQSITMGDAVHFLGLWDLTSSVKDAVSLGIPQLMIYLILPLLSVATTYLQTKMTATDSSQKSMMLIMPIMIGFISLSLPIGLILYWVVSNLFTIGQQAWISRSHPISTQGGQPK